MEEKEQSWEKVSMEATQAVVSMMNPVFDYATKKVTDPFKDKWADMDSTIKEEAWKIIQSIFEGAKKSLDDRLAAIRAEMENWGEISQALKFVPEPFRGSGRNSAWDNLLDGLDSLVQKEEKRELKRQRQRKANRSN